MSLEKDIESLIQSVDLELYNIETVSEYDETIYRVNVISTKFDESGKKVGVTMDQCVELTHLISPLLDVTAPVSGEYRLEVGSAGVERKLKTLDNYIKSVGENVSLVTCDKEKVRGILQKVEDSKIYLKTQEDEIVEVDFGNVSKAKTYFQW